MENPMNKWMIWGYHYFWKHPCEKVCLVAFSKRHSSFDDLSKVNYLTFTTRVTLGVHSFPLGAPTFSHFLTSIYKLNSSTMVGCEFKGFKSWISTWWSTPCRKFPGGFTSRVKIHRKERFHSNLWSLWDCQIWVISSCKSFRILDDFPRTGDLGALVVAFLSLLYHGKQNMVTLELCTKVQQWFIALLPCCIRWFTDNMSNTRKSRQP